MEPAGMPEPRSGAATEHVATEQAEEERAMPAATIDEYLAAVPAEQRAALEVLRAQVHATVPGVTETIAYAIPGFKVDGKYLVGFGATKRACSFYTGHAPIEACLDRLARYRVSRGTITYPADAPLPDDLVADLLRVRLEERRGG
jgi:uncharacterized protein YdhG (YjbR/CyaY superfamily)